MRDKIAQKEIALINAEAHTKIASKKKKKLDDLNKNRFHNMLRIAIRRLVQISPNLFDAMVIPDVDCHDLYLTIESKQTRF